MDGISRPRRWDKEIPHGVLPMEQPVLSDKWVRKRYVVPIAKSNDGSCLRLVLNLFFSFLFRFGFGSFQMRSYIRAPVFWYSQLFLYTFEEERSDWFACFNQIGVNEILVWLYSCVFPLGIVEGCQ